MINNDVISVDKVLIIIYRITFARFYDHDYQFYAYFYLADAHVSHVRVYHVHVSHVRVSHVRYHAHDDVFHYPQCLAHEFVILISEMLINLSKTVPVGFKIPTTLYFP